MFQKTTIYIVLATLCANFSTLAQDNKAIDVTAKGIHIGQQVPDITITGLHNYKDKNGKPVTTAKISDFKGKLLILDFWATWCSPCVAMIPKMDSLQKQFAEKIQFLSTTYQTENEVIPFLQKYEKQKGKHYDMLNVVNDEELHKLFPHTTLPHYVWIDENGIVRAITEAYYINPKNIADLLDKNNITAKVKVDAPIIYNNDNPLFYTNTESGKNLIKQTTWAGYIDGTVRGFDQNLSVKNNDPIKRITARNQTIPELYQIAYRKEQNETVIETKNKYRLSFNTPIVQEYIDWLRNGHAYCYELIVEKSLSDKGREFMQLDLSNHFQEYQAKIEQRKVRCLTLIRTSAIDKIYTNGSKPEAQFDGFGAKLTSCYLSVFITRLKLYLQGNPLPLTDETGYKEMTDLDLKANMGSVKELNAALQKYDLKFVEKEAVIDMLVIRDK